MEKISVGMKGKRNIYIVTRGNYYISPYGLNKRTFNLKHIDGFKLHYNEIIALEKK